MNTLETLKAMDALFSSPDRWAQGWYARTADGIAVGELSDDAVCWCLVGAAFKVSPYASAAIDLLRDSFDSKFISVDEWQDAPERTFADVKALLARAIAAEEAKQ